MVKKLTTEMLAGYQKLFFKPFFIFISTRVKNEEPENQVHLAPGAPNLMVSYFEGN